MKRFLSIVFILSLSFSFGQNIDSLWKVFNNKNEADTNRLRAIDVIVTKYLENKPDTAIVLAEQEMKFAQNSKLPKYEGWALTNLGVSFEMKENYAKALEYHFKCLKLYEQLGDKEKIVAAYLNIGAVYEKQINYSKALEFYFMGMKLIENSNNKIYLEKCYNSIGVVYYSQSDWNKTLEYFVKALKIAIERGDKQNIGNWYNSIGAIYQFRLNDYPKALDYNLKGLKNFEEINDKQGIADSYYNIGQIYWQQLNYKVGLEYHLKALKYYEEINNKPGIAKCYNIKAAAEGLLNSNYKKAMEYYSRCLEIWQELENKGGMATCYSNIGEIYRIKFNYSKAKEYCFKTLQIRKELGDTQGIAFCFTNLGELYNSLNSYELAIQYSDSALQLNKQIKSINTERYAYENLAIAYSKIGKFKEAFESHVKYKALTDSIFNQDNNKKLNDLSNNFAEEKREAEQAKLDAIAFEQKRQQQLVICSVIGILFIVIIFSFFLYRRFKITQKQKAEIEEQKKLVETKSKEIEEHQKEIIDSITYAKRLQQAILPSIEAVKEQLPNSFVYYQPKDIVAGDFYWMHSTIDYVYIAAADCTGHGVPGAIVSVVCSNALNRAVNEFNLTDTGLILDKTRDLVIETFEKSGGEVKDGMDISLLRIDLPLNKSYTKAQWSGANNSLWYILNNELIEVKADKQPIGKYSDPTPFTTNTFNLNSHVSFYLFSDGYADQFSANDKKFMKKKFKETVLSMQNLKMEEQKDVLEKVHVNWKGLMEQTDDVLVIGIRI